MRFDREVYASVALKSEIKDNSNKSHCFYDSRSVYDFLIDHFDYDTAVSAESWTELASVGERYEDEGFEIEMMENWNVRRNFRKIR